MLSFFALAAVHAASDGDLEAQHDALVAQARAEGDGYDAAYAEAASAEMPEGWLLEAEIVRALSMGQIETLLSFPERIDRLGDEFRVGLGRTFYSARQLDGFSDALKCIRAYRMDDGEAFEALAVSSFDKAPTFNQLFGIGELLARHRMEAAQEAQMANFVVPLDMEVASVEGETRSLREWMGDRKALLIDFWASWCGPCIQAMPSLREKAASLPEQGVFVAALNTDASSQLQKAQQVREAQDMGSVPWLLDPNGNKLSSLLMIDSIPRMVLIDREGRILYNGHPLDPSLGDALGKIGVDLAAAH